MALVGITSAINVPQLGYVLEALLASGTEIDCLILDSQTRSEKDLSRFQERTNDALPAIPLHRFSGHRIPVFFVENINDNESRDLIRNRSLDYLVNAGVNRLLKPALLQAPRRGVLSCHPGLLPRFRGCTCVEWAIWHDEPVGNSVHFVVPEIDAGPVIVQTRLNFTKSDNYADVRVMVYRDLFRTLALGVRAAIGSRLAVGDLSPLEGGEYFRPIDDDRLSEVRTRLERGAYAYQF